MMVNAYGDGAWGYGAATGGYSNRSVSRADYTRLRNAILKNPASSEKAFEEFKKLLKDDTNDCFDLEDAYKDLMTIVQKEPTLAKQVLDAVAVGVKSLKNRPNSLEKAYEVLNYIIQTDSTLIKQVKGITIDCIHSAYSMIRATGVLEDLSKNIDKIEHRTKIKGKGLIALLSSQEREEIENDENVTLFRQAREALIEKALKGTEKLEGKEKRKAELEILRKTNVQGLRDAEGRARSKKMADILKRKQKGK